MFIHSIGAHSESGQGWSTWGGGVVIESIISSRLVVRVVLDQQSPLKSRIRVRVALHCPIVEANFNLKHRIKVKTG